jgi:two-component system OmpR family response regulator
MVDLRRKKVLTPILLLTALDAVEYRAQGLNAGADDYLVKPFNLACAIKT